MDNETKNILLKRLEFSTLYTESKLRRSNNFLQSIISGDKCTHIDTLVDDYRLPCVFREYKN